MVATDITYLETREQLDLDDTSSPTIQTLHELIKVILRQPGCRELRYGTIQQAEKQLLFITDWDDLESHGNFVNSDDWAVAGEHLGGLTDATPFTTHYEYPSYDAVKNVIDAPVVELLTCYMKNEDSSYEQSVRKFASEVLANAKGCSGSVSTWSVEDLPHETFGEGHEGKILESIVGWNSTADHDACQAGLPFQENIHLLGMGPTHMAGVQVALRKGSI